MAEEVTPKVSEATRKMYEMLDRGIPVTPAKYEELKQKYDQPQPEPQPPIQQQVAQQTQQTPTAEAEKILQVSISNPERLSEQEKSRIYMESGGKVQYNEFTRRLEYAPQQTAQPQEPSPQVYIPPSTTQPKPLEPPSGTPSQINEAFYINEKRFTPSEVGMIEATVAQAEPPPTKPLTESESELQTARAEAYKAGWELEKIRKEVEASPESSAWSLGEEGKEVSISREDLLAEIGKKEIEVKKAKQTIENTFPG